MFNSYTPGNNSFVRDFDLIVKTTIRKAFQRVKV
jgi:hypothetical protein